MMVTTMMMMMMMMMTLNAYFSAVYFLQNNRDSNWLRAGQPKGWVSCADRDKNFLFFTLTRPVLGPIRPTYPMENRNFTPEVKLPRREADHSPPTSAEVKNTWTYTSTPQYVFMA
jgi:hypothetical protein